METNSFSFYLTLCCKINATFADGAGGTTFKSSKLDEMINLNTTSGHVLLVWQLGSNSIDPLVVALRDRHRVRFGGREAFARAIVFGWTKNLHFSFCFAFLVLFIFMLIWVAHLLHMVFAHYRLTFLFPRIYFRALIWIWNAVSFTWMYCELQWQNIEMQCGKLRN
jgi:hypothetical protein